MDLYFQNSTNYFSGENNSGLILNQKQVMCLINHSFFFPLKLFKNCYNSMIGHIEN